MNYKVSEEKGYVCGIKVVDDEDDIIMISSDGIIIRLRASDVRIMGRYATGVRMMKLQSEDSRVVTFTRAEHEEDAEITEIEQPSDEELAAEEAAAEAEEAKEVVEEDTEPEDDDGEE